ncbi:MAG: RraA family protein [Hyphomicrobiaceae bacterium]
MLEDPPLLVVRKSFTRLPMEKLAKLEGVQTGHLVDAMDGRGALDAAIKPVNPTRAQFFGSALTVETGPSDNLAILAALGLAKPGDVLVCASDAFSVTAVVGDNVCLMGRNVKLAAFVIDGMVRDLDGIVGVGLPCFARGITPNSCVKSGPGRIGLPIVAGGIAIESGDVVAGDRDGVVVVPRAQFDKVVGRLDRIRKLEAEIQTKIGEGMFISDKIASLLKSERVKYVD